MLPITDLRSAPQASSQEAWACLGSWTRTGKSTPFAARPAARSWCGRCRGTYRDRGKWWTTSGTGAYDDVLGHGHYRVSVQFFGCDPEAEPDVVTVTIRAAGPLSY